MGPLGKMYINGRDPGRIESALIDRSKALISSSSTILDNDTFSSQPASALSFPSSVTQPKYSIRVKLDPL
jgi:hypothetical protein